MSLAVPTGSTARGTSWPATSRATEATVPSPPTTTIESAARSKSARRRGPCRRSARRDGRGARSLPAHLREQALAPASWSGETPRRSLMGPRHRGADPLQEARLVLVALARDTTVASAGRRFASRFAAVRILASTMMASTARVSHVSAEVALEFGSVRVVAPQTSSGHRAGTAIWWWPWRCRVVPVRSCSRTAVCSPDRQGGSVIRYIQQRVLLMVPAVLLTSLVVFLMLHLIPGNPASIYLGENQATPERLEQIRSSLGLNRPLYVQFGDFLLRAARGDLGRSVRPTRSSRRSPIGCRTRSFWPSPRWSWRSSLASHSGCWPPAKLLAGQTS